VAAPIRAAGHTVHLPTLLGNGAGDDKSVGLEAVIARFADGFSEQGLSDAVVVAHSYGGMVVTGAADRLPPGSIRRLVYVNAFVPNSGESLEDLAPPLYGMLFDEIVEADGSVMIPYPIWREAFMNDAGEALALASHRKLNAHPYATFRDKIQLRTNPVEWPIGKSYINCTEDTAMPHSMPWHPRLSEKLGLYRLVQTPGGHELLFTNPDRLAQAILDAGRD
jgi:pimeloyl-ACP methyl ester carboxylesterase